MCASFAVTPPLAAGSYSWIVEMIDGGGEGMGQVEGSFSVSP